MIMHPLGIARLKLSHFRSYAYFDLEVSTKHVVLAGQNGIGKTNVLEAVSFLSSGRGLRKAKLTDISPIGSHYKWAVVAELFDGESFITVGTGIDPENSGSRLIRINGVEVPSANTLNLYTNIHWITPALDRIFLEGGTQRRAFFDKFVSALFPNHLTHLSRFEKLMRERNFVLKGRAHQPGWLQSLEYKMVEESIVLAFNRLETLGLLKESLEVIKNTTPFSPGVLHFSEGIEKNIALGMPSVEAEMVMLQHLEQSREEDSFSGKSSIGAHKMDFTLTHGVKNIEARFCSTGEQKNLLFGLMLAFLQLQRIKSVGTPILLLDEVAAHLDDGHRKVLFKTLDELDIQVWYTGTDFELFNSLNLYDTSIVDVKKLV